MSKCDNSPLISVIVPVYNVEKYLNKCVDSILGQTFRDFEVLLVDDGSPDRCPQICDEYARKDSRVRVFHQPNKGVGAARNLGILNIRGGYLTFLDSDDFYDPDHLQNFVEYIKEGYDWITCRTCGVREDGEVSYPKKVAGSVIKANSRQEIDDLMGNFPSFPWVNNKLFKTSIVRENGLSFILTSNFNEDITFNINFSQYACSLVVLPYPTYNYVYNPNSITKNKYVKPRKFLNTAIAMDELIGKGLLGKNGISYTGNFSVKFFVRTFLCCLAYPSKELQPDGRLRTMRDDIKAAWNSNFRRKYPLTAIKFGFKNLIRYLRKAIKK